MSRTPPAPVRLDPAVEDPAVIDALIDAHAPYWPVQRYVANNAEYAALSGNRPEQMVIGPVFRGDWAAAGRVADGVAPLLHDERFVAAARSLFDAEVVRPHTVYANLTWQLPFAQGQGHTDIPAFRGMDRRTVPVAFLTIMGCSGLFEAERIRIATGVAWFYRGADGGFEYWPDGPDAPSVVHEGDIDNTMVVGDNDFMWHRVRPTGDPADGMPTLTLDSELVRRDAERWAIVEGDRTIAEVPRHELRVSLSWKADVFADAAEAELADSHRDDLDLDEVLRRFAADLADRGETIVTADDPVRDPALLTQLAETYVRYPTTSAS
ncbi:MAG: hypothetical protein JJU45_12295 [Acidimicrobiia bacterium]|nr:hypothetical protein [Acidimicrobiia bacterium]